MTRMIRYALMVGLAFAAQQATAQGQAPAGNKADPNAGPTFQQVHAIDAQLIQLGQLAQQKGSTSNVKDYGKRTVDEHQRIDKELTQIAQNRGIQLAPVEQIQSWPQHAQEVQRLQGLNGIQFDQAIMDRLVQVRQDLVPVLKQLRDKTPGTDAQLKKWLSDTEVTMEHLRNESRDVRQAVNQQAQAQQRQGRKP